jgi:hypothetical protein
VLIVGRYEDDRRHAVGANRFDDLEPVHLRHLDVQEDEIGGQIVDGGERLLAVAGLRDDLHVRLRRQQAGDPLSGQRLVVRDYDLHLLHGVSFAKAARHAAGPATPRRRVSTPPNGSAQPLTAAHPGRALP